MSAVGNGVDGFVVKQLRLILLEMVFYDIPVERRTRTNPQGRGSASPFQSQQTAQQTTRCSSQ